MRNPRSPQPMANRRGGEPPLLQRVTKYSRGFFAIPPLPLWMYACGVAAIFLLFGIVQTHRLHASQKEYSAFVAQVKAQGVAQERKTKETIERQMKESYEAEERSKRAIADIRSKYDRLRESSAYRGLVPPVPETTALPDDSARDSRLLEVLRFAEEQTRQLTELQAWVQQQQSVK